MRLLQRSSLRIEAQVLSDEAVHAFSRLANLRELSLSGARGITGEGLAALKDLPQLRVRKQIRTQTHISLLYCGCVIGPPLLAPWSALTPVVAAKVGSFRRTVFSLF